MEESFNKERDTRLHWYFSTFKPRQAENNQHTSKQYEVFLRRIQASRLKPTEELERLSKEKQSTESCSSATPVLPDISSGAKTKYLSNDTRSMTSSRDVDEQIRLPPLPRRDMNAVDRRTRGLLTAAGRSTYLRARLEARPEEKYNYPVISSWEYGWKLDDVIDVEELRNPEYGRSRIVADTFYRNNSNGLVLSHRLQ